MGHVNNEVNTVLNDGFTQVCVWPGTTLGEGGSGEIVEWFKDEFDIEIQFLEVILTNQDRNQYGDPIPNTGGRSDVLFAVKDGQANRFAPIKMHIAARWFDDVDYNNQGHLYPERCTGYYSWDTTRVKPEGKVS